MHCFTRSIAVDGFELIVVCGGVTGELGEKIEALMNSAAATKHKISPRERQVLAEILKNLANKEIANNLNLSVRTVKFHVSALLAKFGVTDRAALRTASMSISQGELNNGTFSVTQLDGEHGHS